MSAPPPISSIRTGINTFYYSLAVKTCNRIRENPEKPVTGRDLTVLREAADRRDEPSGGGDGTIAYIIAALYARLQVAQEQAKQPGADFSRTEFRAFAFLENLAIERDRHEGKEVPKTAAELRKERDRHLAAKARSKQRVEEALERDMLREVEEATLARVRSSAAYHQPAAS